MKAGISIAYIGIMQIKMPFIAISKIVGIFAVNLDLKIIHYDKSV
jgi:hypothetical protein